VGNSGASGILEDWGGAVARGLRPLTSRPDSTARRMAEVPPDEEVTRLFSELHASLRRYMIFLGASPQDADDGVQETFLRLHKHLQTGAQRINLQAWLFHVAKNLVRDRRKSAWMRFRSALGPSDEWLSFLREPGDTPEGRLLRAERLAWFHSAIVQLTPQQAECLRLRAAGLRYREIAEVMGIGISAVGELVQRAVTQLNKDSNGH